MASRRSGGTPTLGSTWSRSSRARSTSCVVVCHIDADVTLGDIFRAVEQDSELVRFLKEWSWCSVDAFHLEARKATRKYSDLANIENTKYFEWDKWEAQETIHVSGIGEPGEHGTPHYGLDFTPVNEPAHGGVRMWMWPLPTRWMDGGWSWHADDSSYRDGERREVRRRWASRRTHRFK